MSHAYVRLVDFGSPVTIGGVEIRSGDLIHADKHGVCLIPDQVAAKLAEACAEVERRERPILEFAGRRAFHSKSTSSSEPCRTPRLTSDETAIRRPQWTFAKPTLFG